MSPGTQSGVADAARKALIVGLSGVGLQRDEAAFLSEIRPAGIILFTRNCESHPQIKALIEDVLNAIGSDRTLVLIDQEGGRVQRLRPPLGRALPPARVYADIHALDPLKAIDMVAAVYRLMAADLRALGINTDCLPVLDVPVPGAHDVIGDRAYGSDPETIIALGVAAARGLMYGAVLPVMKHIPGHGRAGVDSHHALPAVRAAKAELEATDFVPFQAFNTCPAAMTAHVVFDALDPENPASTSRSVTRDIIRSHIGFDGLLMSDDLSMQALSGDMSARAAAVIAAGSDVALHCNGDLGEMQAAATATPMLSGDALRRFEACLHIIEAAPTPFDVAEAEAFLAEALAHAAGTRPESV